MTTNCEARAGRQGDPGSTRFFLSLEDNLLRIFGGDRVAGLMDAFRVEEDMPIESGMLTRSLEGAQRKVETFYYDARKQVFEYDEVMNNQRRCYLCRTSSGFGGDGPKRTGACNTPKKPWMKSSRLMLIPNCRRKNGI
ncbi:MAG UNVERIFIED_CONTAM: hypothetical protein LVR29_07880 [Microcystis novacekii LVE1205-3]